MEDPFLGQLLAVSFNFAPKGWALCNGQLLAINQNQALFSLLGTTFGGDGRTTFALPDLRGRIPAGAGQSYVLGAQFGSESATITLASLPTHNHLLNVSNTDGNAKTPANNVYADTSVQSLNQFSTNNPAVSMNGGVIGQTGGSQPHTNQQPYLVINWIIALQGIFPSQN
jgi:microcystin-dependent protein